MRKTFILFIFFKLMVISLSGQTQPWKEAEGSDMPSSLDRQLSLDLPQMDSLLRQADQQPATINLPLPNGTYQPFLIEYSPVMEAELAARYPQIRTYAGYGVDDPSLSVRLDRTPQGFHALVTQTSSLRSYYIDPIPVKDDATQGGSSWYRCYFPIRRELKAFPVEIPGSVDRLFTRSDLPPEGSFAGERLLYRLAVSATGEYTQYHGGRVEDGLAAIVTTINRVNAVYERDLGVRLILVGDNDQLVFTDPETDPFTPLNERSQNQRLLDELLGPAGYDIGHVFGVGGASNAQGSLACLDGQKGRAYSGLGDPVGDPFDIDFVAHEIGHQLGASHTFNKCGILQGEQPYEPGSGTTIMGYAGVGLCFDEDHLSANSSDYFHNASISEIFVYTRLGDGRACAASEPVNNEAPVIELLPAGPAIPHSTPFALSASAIDPDDDPLSWCWEEFDAGPPTLPDAPQGSAPLFRSFPPVADSFRIFPRLDSLLAGQPSRGEVLPDYARPLTFRLTLRDGRGGVSWATTELAVTDEAGPFQLTAPNGGEVWQPGSVVTVSWDVANTDQPPVNAALVDILLSSDGGYTWPYVLAAATPNDGAAPIVVPAGLEGSTFRVKVEARDNVFFDVSDGNFTIDAMTPVATVQDVVTALHVFPNPAKEAATFRFQLSRPATLSLVLYGSDGRLTARHALGLLPAGDHWRTIDLAGLPAGAYVYVLEGIPGVAGRLIKE